MFILFIDYLFSAAFLFSACFFLYTFFLYALISASICSGVFLGFSLFSASSWLFKYSAKEPTKPLVLLAS
jgi:hypothetical protein